MLFVRLHPLVDGRWGWVILFGSDTDAVWKKSGVAQRNRILETIYKLSHRRPTSPVISAPKVRHKS